MITKTQDNKCIYDRVEKHYHYLEFLGYNVVAVFAQGSMNYGLYVNDDEYKSDVDTKAIVLPTLDDLVNGNKMVSTKYDFEGEQIDVKDIRVMMDMWVKSNPAYLEILFTKYCVLNSKFEDYLKQILEMGNDIVKMNYPQLAKCMSGMSKEKVIAMEHPYPSQLKDLEKFGYCPKQIHHIIRLNQLIKDVYQNNISFGDALLLNRLPEFSSYLINVKKGKLSLEQARLLAKEKDEETKKIKDEILEKYKDFEFDSNTYNKLKSIVNKMVKYNIVSQIKEDC
jgi:hypothetical protein